MKDLLLRLLSVFTNRIIIIFICLITGFIFIWFLMYRTQILQHAHYTELQSEDLYAHQAVTAERGNIYDKNGVPLAINVETKALMYMPSVSNPDLPASIEALLLILDKNQVELSLDVEFPIGYEEGRGFYFKDGFTPETNSVAHGNFLAEVFYSTRDELTPQQLEVTATECIEILCDERFEISRDHEPSELLRILSVRYAIFSARFDTSVNVLIAKGLDARTEAQIMERTGEFNGFTIKTLYSREYPQGELFAHIVGYVGRISEEELAGKQAKGLDYTEDDYIGKAGIEAACEESLRGTTGTLRIGTDSNTGAIITSITTREAVRGNDIYLTVDAQLQRQTYDALVDQIKTLLVNKITGVSGPSGSTYSTADVFCSLIDNHFLDDLLVKDPTKLTADHDLYLYSFLTCCSNAYYDCTDELYDLIVYAYEYPLMEYQTWNKQLYDMLITNMRDEMHLSYDYQEDPDFYPSYLEGQISPYSFFCYCLDNSLLDESVYDYSRNASYDTKIRTILSYELEKVRELPEFSAYIYSFILSTGRYSEYSFMYMLYEQGLLSNADGTRNFLENEEMNVVQVLKLKILQNEITPAQINLDPCSGSVVVTDPQTGEVRAMVSYPSFDPNLFMSSDAYYNAIIQDKSGPLSFRAVEELRAIGSTFKMCTALTGLTNGVITAKTEIYDDVAFPWSNDPNDPTCWSAFSHGSIDVIHALDYSCNYFFYQVGFLLSEPKPARAEDPPFGSLSTPDSQYYFDDDVGLTKLKAMTDLLGLSAKTGIEIAESEPIASTLDAVRSAIGQGNGSYSCANLNRYTCTLANGGNVYDLYLVGKILDAKGKIVYSAKPVLDHKTNIKKEYISLVKQGMRLVVTDDHQYEFEDLEALGIHCAGKTGTAQEDENRPDHSLFTGYSDLNKPRIAISVMIPFGGGSANAIPVFVSIMADYYGVSLDRNSYE
ncbi:MAG: hypothetical protein HUJ69_08835 [Lachnospiraceae bacterium]|nr:hypothetical protein [Lachnospiraceae bacterium]